MENLNVEILSASGQIKNAQLKINVESYCKIECVFDVQSRFKVTGDDLFDCLIALRRFLEEQKDVLLCNGARVDVYPSPMSRQMGQGRFAYILKSGEQAKSENMVDIFGYAEPKYLGTVEEQYRFYKNWIKSLHHDG